MKKIADYLIVVPLDEEFGYVRDIIQSTVDRRRFGAKTIGPEVYATGLVSTDSGDASVVFLSVGRMAESPVQSAVDAAVKLWCPSTVILVGIAGSLEPDKLRLGDVIVPSKVFGYTEGKVTTIDGKQKVAYRHTGHVLDCYLTAIARAVNLDHQIGWRAACRRAGKRDSTLAPRLLDPEAKGRPRLHIGNNDCLASGNLVVASKEFADEIRAILGETVRAVEMEAKGMCEALAKIRPSPPALVIRGISDYSDEDKSKLEKDFRDGWRSYAAQNAARFMAEMIRRRPKIEEGYQAVASPIYTMFPIQSSAATCMEARINAREKGMRYLAFCPFMKCEDGLPATTLKFEAINSGQTKGLFLDILLRTEKDHRPLERSKNVPSVIWKLERSVKPENLELLVGVDEHVVEVRLTATDEDFGRSSENRWHV